ncbi:hypothetical protein AB3S75_039281 [Citrus x aurantiifolia]
MEELGSFWSYQESVDDLKQKLLYTSLELETVKMEANEALKKQKEEVKNLLNLLKVAYQERDEAKDQLQNLLNKLMSSSPTELNPRIHRHVQHESPLVVPTKANSSITESNSLSETYNPQSHISSPVDSFFDAVSSPEFSNINMADSGNMGRFVNQPFVRDINGSMPTSLVPPAAVTKMNPGTAVIDSIAKGKKLPQHGKLLQSVMEAGPLLQTLLVAGPLPRWRNPPPLQPFKIPPFSLKGCETMNVNQTSLNSSPYHQMSRMSSQMCSTSMLNFSSCPAGSGPSNGMLLTSGAGIGNQKRQRLQ